MAAIQLQARPVWSVAPSDLGNPDRATAQTVAIMCQHVRNSCADPLVQRAAWDATSRWAHTGPVGPGAVATSAFWWVKHRMKFVHHQVLAMQMLNKADALQLLISPDVIVRMARPVGDCAIYAMMCAAILACHGVPFEFVTVAVNPDQPNDFTHVYLRAVMPNGDRVPLDASHGPRPGWRVPDRRVSRQKVWDASGNEVSDAGAGEGLGSYVARGLGDDSSGTLFPYTFDLGDDSVSGNLFPYTIGSGQPAASTSSGNWCDPSSPDCYTLPSWASGAGSSSSGSSLFDSTLANLANSWTKIAGNVIAPQTTIVRGPNGLLSISTPAGSDAGSNLLATGGLVSTGGSSWLVIGGLALGAVLLMSMLKK